MLRFALVRFCKLFLIHHSLSQGNHCSLIYFKKRQREHFRLEWLSSAWEMASFLPKASWILWKWVTIIFSAIADCTFFQTKEKMKRKWSSRKNCIKTPKCTSKLEQSVVSENHSVSSASGCTSCLNKNSCWTLARDLIVDWFIVSNDSIFKSFSFQVVLSYLVYYDVYYEKLTHEISVYSKIKHLFHESVFCRH